MPLTYKNTIPCAMIKAEQMKGPVLTEDSALEFLAINGLPGPYVYVTETLGLYAVQEFYSALEITDCVSFWLCAFSSRPGVEPVLFQGRVDSQTVTPRGSNGFAFDPIFEVQGRIRRDAQTKACQARGKNKVIYRWTTRISCQNCSARAQALS
ncbi:Ham1 family pyrophosphatase, putative [Aspergillus fumigatus A1163]|uniref:Ham1 family pyrophosphatase, putative n=1 Tax=Aspergillus fumigatus (strain CBS 144.89 / FGSC A1163 / CEA10) TaxID=451804 RepID=B0YAV6_ASPFC|nr:Ham1 family pyrophosphatase, putative [Aspergillus fumigatus A1163]